MASTRYFEALFGDLNTLWVSALLGPFPVNYLCSMRKQTGHETRSGRAVAGFETRTWREDLLLS